MKQSSQQSGAHVAHWGETPTNHPWKMKLNKLAVSGNFFVMTGTSTSWQRGWTCIFEYARRLQIWHPTAPWELEAGTLTRWSQGKQEQLSAPKFLFDLNGFCHNAVVVCALFGLGSWQPRDWELFFFPKYINSIVAIPAFSTVIGLGMGRDWIWKIQGEVLCGSFHLIGLL